MARSGDDLTMTNFTRFAWVVDEAESRTDELWDREILRTDAFVAMPSAGSLVAGWTLVVPRRPMLNLAELDEAGQTALDLMVTPIADALAGSGDSVFCFEHGAGWMGSATGCGVDQAHLHIVPLPFDLLAVVARRQDAAITWQIPAVDRSPLAQLPSQGEYVALWSIAERRPMIGHVRRPISQWIRRVIADELGIADQWDYRIHPQTEKVRQTLEMLSGLQATSAQ